MNTVEKSAQDLEKAIANRVREYRQERNWTLEKLAEVTGLSKSYLSQIENCEKNPPIGTLTKIAFGLGINVLALITGENPDQGKPRMIITRKGEGRPVLHAGAGPGSGYESLVYKKTDRLMDGYIATIGPELPPEPLVHEGQELALVLDGRQEFFYNNQSFILESGDCIYFDSDQPHYARSLDGKPSRILVVFCNPKKFI